MGWDLWARAPDWSELDLVGGSLGDEPGPLRLADEELRLAFYDAYFLVRYKAHRADGGLKLAYLDCSACAHAIEQATGWDTYTSPELDTVALQELLADANWAYSTEDDWATMSSRIFLETCAAHDLQLEVTV